MTHRATLSIDQLIKRGAFSVNFQPVVDLQTGQTFAYECLVRAQNTSYANPEELFNTAVITGDCGKLGRHIRELATAGCPDWPLFLNIHPSEFDEPYLVQTDDPMFGHDHYVYLELTESLPLGHFDQCKSVLKEVRVKNIKLAIDDLGAGYSNLRYLADLSPEMVKLDRGLIQNVVAGSRQQRLITGIVALCETMGAKSVCEGIETQQELEVAVASGAAYGQGYFLGRPADTPIPGHWPL